MTVMSSEGPALPDAAKDPNDALRMSAFTILSRLQSGTEEVVRLDVALAAVAMERERCAGVCDTIYAIDSAHAAKVCAAAIRGRIRERCPFPRTGHNGSVSQCKERGHCGCGA